MPMPVEIYDRPSVAIARLFEGDIAGAGKALLTPESLAPEKLSTLGEEIMGGYRQAAKQNPMVKAILGVVTDPLIIASVLLSSKWPIQAAGKMFTYAQKFSAYHRAPGILSRIFGRAEHIFGGTNIPKLMAKSATDTAEFTWKWNAKLADWLETYKKQTGHRLAYDDQLKLVAKLEGLDRVAPGRAINKATQWMARPMLAERIQLEPALQRLHDQMKQQFFPAFHKEVVAPMIRSDPGKNAIKKALRMGNMESTEVNELLAMALPRNNYFPHMVMRTPGQARDFIQQLMGVTKGDPRLVQAAERASALGQVSRHALPRFGTLVPDLKQLARVGVVRPGLAVDISNYTAAAGKIQMATGQKIVQDALKKAKTTENRVGLIEAGLRRMRIPTSAYRKELADMTAAIHGKDAKEAFRIIDKITAGTGATLKYNMEFIPVMRHYVYSFARPFVWTTSKIGKGFKGIPSSLPLGKALLFETDRLEPLTQRMMRTDYLPMLQGHLTEHQIEGSLGWANQKMKMMDALDNPTGMARHIPEGMKTKLKDLLTDDKGAMSYLNAQGKVAGYFYFSTLGFNPASAMQNLLQTTITTLPAVGTSAYWKGMKNTVQKLTGPNGYFSLRGRGIDPTEALRRAFPQFTKMGMAPAPLSEMVLRGALEETWSSAKHLPRSLLGGAGKAPWLESLKRASMAMFSGTETWNRLMSFESGLAKAATDGLRGKAQLEFASAVVRAGQFPAGVGQMPRVLLKLPAPWRQFMYFPMRFAGFLAESTRFGGGVKRDWGTVARTMGISAGVAKVFKEGLGVDITRGLAMGALPLPQYEQSPFFPWPFVPPVASIAGSAALAAFKGDIEPLKQAASLLVPAGVPMRRMYKTFAPRYARYEERRPDGKIPVYNDKHALIGNYSPMQLIMRAIGFRTTNDAAQTAMSRYLLKQRDVIRDIRRDYVEAMVMGDPDEAARIQDAFKRMYPSLGPITLKKSDIEAVRQRHTMTRLQRMTKTMPAEYRPEFQDLVNTVASQQYGNLFGRSGREPPTLGGGAVPQMFGSPATGMGMGW